MNLFKTLLLAALVASSVASARAQQQPACTLKADRAPALRGFRLGMPLAEVKTRFPAAPTRQEPFGAVAMTIQQEQLRSADGVAYAGVDYVTLFFLDERVTNVSMQYDYTSVWKSPEQFAARVSELLKLPNSWQRLSSESPFMEMKCDGFVVSTTPNFIRLIDPSAEQTLARRKEEAEEKARQSFKP